MVWFMPLEKFAMGFGLYVLAGILALVMQGTSIFQAFVVSFVIGILIFAVVAPGAIDMVPFGAV